MGYYIGVCCSFITFLVILACSIGAAVLVYELTKDEAKKIDTSTTVYSITDQLFSLSIGYLTILVALALIIYFSIFFILMCYTKRVSTPDFSYNTIFMFISGYCLSFIILYLILGFACFIEGWNNDDIKNTTIKDLADDASETFLILADFLIFGYILKLSGLCIMLMLYHRKFLKKMMILIGIGVYFGPIIFYMIGLYAKNFDLLAYPLFVFDLASIVLGIVLYIINSKFALPDQGQIYSAINPITN